MKTYEPDNMVNGIPKKSSKKKKETASEYYKLGRTAAFLEKEKERVDNQAKMNLIQQMALSELMLKIKEMKLELESQQKLAMNMQLQSMFPPIPQDVGLPMGMPPPLPEAPPNIAGIPPLPVENMPPADLQQMPPPDMMGGGIPQQDIMLAPAPPMA